MNEKRSYDAQELLDVLRECAGLLCCTHFPAERRIDALVHVINPVLAGHERRQPPTVQELTGMNKDEWTAKFRALEPVTRAYVYGILVGRAKELGVAFDSPPMLIGKPEEVYSLKLAVAEACRFQRGADPKRGVPK